MISAIQKSYEIVIHLTALLDTEQLLVYVIIYNLEKLQLGQVVLSLQDFLSVSETYFFFYGFNRMTLDLT